MDPQVDPDERRALVSELNPHLLCSLCSGYMVDASTITECLHSFCRSCIYKYLESSKYCPICDVQIHKTKPHVNIKADKTLQTLIYKLVPNLLKNELQRRQEFFDSHPETDASSLSILLPAEHHHIVDRFKFLRSLKDQSRWISLCIRPITCFQKALSSDTLESCFDEASMIRYFFCPPEVKVLHLKKLLREKFELDESVQIEMFHADELIKDFMTLSAVTESNNWDKKNPFDVDYSIKTSPADQMGQRVGGEAYYEQTSRAFKARMRARLGEFRAKKRRHSRLMANNNMNRKRKLEVAGKSDVSTANDKTIPSTPASTTTRSSSPASDALHPSGTSAPHRDPDRTRSASLLASSEEPSVEDDCLVTEAHVPQIKPSSSLSVDDTKKNRNIFDLVRPLLQQQQQQQQQQRLPQQQQQLKLRFSTPTLGENISPGMTRKFCSLVAAGTALHLQSKSNVAAGNSSAIPPLRQQSTALHPVAGVVEDGVAYERPSRKDEIEAVASAEADDKSDSATRQQRPFPLATAAAVVVGSAATRSRHSNSVETRSTFFEKFSRGLDLHRVTAASVKREGGERAEVRQKQPETKSELDDRIAVDRVSAATPTSKKSRADASDSKTGFEASHVDEETNAEDSTVVSGDGDNDDDDDDQRSDFGFGSEPGEATGERNNRATSRSYKISKREMCGLFMDMSKKYLEEFPANGFALASTLSDGTGHHRRSKQKQMSLQ